MTKWGDVPHWEHDATWLGSDDHGVWCGTPAGTLMQRPGHAYSSTTDMVRLVPAPASGDPGGWVASFYARATGVRTYVDMTTVPKWEERTGRSALRAIDLDLDVVRTAEGHVFVDDEDEFAEHRVAFGYPSEVVSLAEESCAWVLESVLAERAPFDGDTSDAWLETLARLRRR